MSMTLYQLTDAYKQLQAMIEDTDTPTEALLDTFESIKDELPVKVENTAKVIRATEYNIQAVKVEIERLRKILKNLESKQEWLQNNVISSLQSLDIPEVKTPTMTIKLAKNPPSVEIITRDMIPREFIRTTIVEDVDKNAIKEALKAGQEVPGARQTQGTSLRIR